MNTSVAEPDIKHQLLFAAIELFAEQGIEAISMRMVNRHSGAKNNSAAHYHFGSKEGLVDAAILFIQDWFELRREASLRALEAEAAAASINVREVLSVLAGPYIQVIQEESWGYAAVRFIAHTQFDHNSFSRKVHLKHAEDFVQRLSFLVRKALPDVPYDVAMYRLNFSVLCLIQNLANSRLEPTGLFHKEAHSLDALLDLYLDYSAAGMLAPIHSPQKLTGFLSESPDQLHLLI